MPNLESNQHLINTLRKSGMSNTELVEECGKCGHSISLSDLSQFLSGWKQPTADQKRVINLALQRWHQQNQPKGAMDEDRLRETEMKRQMPGILRELRAKGYSFTDIAEMMGTSEAVAPILANCAKGEQIDQELVHRFWHWYSIWSLHQE